MSAKLISLIGPPAVGKTTLAELLAADLGAELILEDFDRNPFLADSYVGGAGSRLPAQLYFLLSRVRQLSRASWPAAGLRVSDYGFCHDRVYAELKLGPEDLAVYDTVARRVEGYVKPADVTVHLDAPVDVLRRRILDRGRSFEAVMDEAFLSAMRARYNQVVGRIEGAVVRVDCEAVDVRDDGRRAVVEAQVRRRLWT